MSRSVGRSSVGWFLAWFGVGALDALAIVGALTIGIFVLPVGIAATVFLATRRDASDGIGGLICGLGLPVLYVAYLNRDGPRTICRTYPGGGSSCVEEWSRGRGSPSVWLLCSWASPFSLVPGVLDRRRTARRRRCEANKTEA